MAITDIVKKTLTPLLYINLVVMAFAGLTLVYWGYLGAAGPGFFGLFLSPIAFPFLLLPVAILTGMLRLSMKSEAHPVLDKALTVLSIAYIAAVLSAWTVLMFYFLVGAPEVPAAMYAVASSVLPWLIFAAKDRENVFFTGQVIMLQVSALVLVALNVALRLSDPLQKFGIIWAFMMVCAGVEALVENIMLDIKKKKEPVKPAS